VLELADIFRAAGPEICAQLAVLPSQKRAVQAILQCRTAELGGEVYGCLQCGQLHFSYHSCGNRHCPKCHGQQTEQWLEKQRLRLLPCPYYLLTFTLPAELRALARSEQKLVYGVLLSAAAASIQKLCRDPQWLGAQPALLEVLHTWTRAMLYHPHAHFLVSAGGLSADGQQWVPAKNPKFLVPVRALSRIFRAKVRDALKAAGKWEQVPVEAWKKKWVVHAQHAGSGQKVLDYLGRYVFRIAITQSRLESLQDGQVTFHYRDNRTQQIKRVRLPVAEFIQRFLQHVLPKGFAKVGHYGLDSSACGERLVAAMALLLATSVPPPNPQSQPLSSNEVPSETDDVLRCPHCRIGRLIWLGQILPSKKIPP
jgi:Putative transposase/Transposase zinc-binding domain